MKKIFILLIVFIAMQVCEAQLDIEHKLDSIANSINFINHDTSKAQVYFELAEFLYEYNEKGIYKNHHATKYCEKGLLLSNNHNWIYGQQLYHYLLGMFDWKNGNYKEALVKYIKSLNYLKQTKYFNDIARRTYQVAVLNARNGNYKASLSNYIESIKFYEILGDKKGVARNYSDIGSLYISLEDNENAKKYLFDALELNKQLNDSFYLAMNYGNLGVLFSSENNYEESLKYSLLSNKYRKIVDEYYVGGLLNIASSYNYLGNLKEAAKYFKLGADTSKHIKYYQGYYMCVTRLGLVKTSLYEKDLLNNNQNVSIEIREDVMKSINEFHEAIEYYKVIGSSSEVAFSNYVMSNLYKTIGDYKNAFEYYSRYIDIDDSLKSESVKVQIADLESKRELEIKDKENKILQQDAAYKELTLSTQRLEILRQNQGIQLLENEKQLQHLAFLKEQAEKQEKTQKLSLVEKEKALQESQIQSLNKEKYLQEATIRTKNQQRNGFIAGSILLFLLAGAIFMGLRRTAKEKKVSETLLLNILPAEVAQELKAKGEAEAKLIDDATVLFTDFKGFTGLSEILTPKELVSDLNHCFSAFDKITQKYGIEKIKTIGDAYMAAGGLPSPNKTHAKDVVLAAIEIKEFMDKGKLEKIAKNQPFFEIRIGVNTGPVVAGIVGVKKFQYDIWGDTVNTASRMESSGEIGKVNISQSTYELLKNDSELDFEHRGKVSAKGKGEVDMYFVKLRS
jgi:adenylate cyclase